MDGTFNSIIRNLAGQKKVVNEHSKFEVLQNKNETGRVIVEALKDYLRRSMV